MKIYFPLSILWMVLWIFVSGCKSTDDGNAAVNHAVSSDNQHVSQSSAISHALDNNTESDDLLCHQWPSDDYCILNPELITLMIMDKHEVNEGNSFAQIPLMFAKDPTSVRILISAGADVNARDSDDMTPLMYAADPESIQILIKNGALPNAVDNEGRTALFYVQSVEAAKALIDNGVDPTIKDKYGKTCLELDDEAESSRVSEYVRKAMEN